MDFKEYTLLRYLHDEMKKVGGTALKTELNETSVFTLEEETFGISIRKDKELFRYDYNYINSHIQNIGMNIYRDVITNNIIFVCDTPQSSIDMCFVRNNIHRWSKSYTTFKCNITSTEISFGVNGNIYFRVGLHQQNPEIVAVFNKSNVYLLFEYFIIIQEIQLRYIFEEVSEHQMMSELECVIEDLNCKLDILGGK